MYVPSFQLPKHNIFNFRQQEWDETKIINNVIEMLKCGTKYDIITKKVIISNKKKTDLTEIKKTISKILSIELSIAGGTKDIKLEYIVPWLQKNYFYISGSRKIPIFQMFDRPLIIRGDMIKVRTNIQTIQMNYNNNRRGNYHFVVSLFNKKIPLVYFIYCIHGEESLRKLIPTEDEIVGERRQKFIDDVITFLSDDIIDTNKIFSKYFRGKSDEDIVENILLLTDIDIFSKQYMFTDNVIDELVWAIDACDNNAYGPIEMRDYWKNLLDDCCVENKRLRCIEYFLYHFLSKDFYNLMISLKKTKRDNFSNNSKIILMNANVSPIVQYETPINPLDELARLTRIALTGPGGFKKDNIPPYLRNIHPSMFGRICPSDTGDRDNCGALQYIVPPFEITNDGIFRTPHDHAVPSISISHVPFLEHNDPTRLQMASSQMRHSIMLKEFDSPLIQSGIEGMFTDQTSFIFKAERDGKVIYKNKDIIVIQYNNGKCQPFNIGYKKSRLSIVDFYKCYFNSEEENKTLPEDEQQPTKFKMGDIISESNYLHNGRLTIGRNFKTCVMTWFGYNFEDAIIVSEKVKDKMTSLHYIDLSFDISSDKVLLSLSDDPDKYEPLPKIGQKISKGEVYVKVKTLISKQEGYNDIIFDSPNEKICDENCIVTDVKIFVRSKNKILPVFDDYISKLVQKQNETKQELISKLRHHLTKEELEQFLLDLEIDETSKEEEKFKIKGEMIEGIMFSITAIYERPLQIGDKLGNRHGNKGVVSIIVKEDKMPRLEDGSHADVIINPLGIISRMNIGQLFELHLAQSLIDLKNTIRSKYDHGLKRNIPKEELESSIYLYIINYIKIIDKTKDGNYTKQMEEKLEIISIEQLMDFLDHFYIIQPPFESVKLEDLILAMEYTNTKFIYPCFEPITKQNIKNDVAFGYMYFEKLNHIAQDKLSVRGIGPYTTKTNQPLPGKIRKGGQRLGEMEIWAAIAHGASCNLTEILTTKSDSIRNRNKYISDMVQNSDLLIENEEDQVSQSLRLFQSYLKVIGLDYLINEENTDMNQKISITSNDVYDQGELNHCDDLDDLDDFDDLWDEINN